MPREGGASSNHHHSLFSTTALFSMTAFTGSPAFAGDDSVAYSAACCCTVGSVPATVARRMSRGCD